MRRLAIVLLATLLAGALAGCVGGGEPAEAVGGDANLVTPPDPSVARFAVEGLRVEHPDGFDRPPHEDDAAALVRWTVRQPDDAPKAETGFVSLLLNGRIVFSEAVRLEPGAGRDFGHRVDLAEVRELELEVRAGAARATLQETVRAWPRLDGELRMGPLALSVASLAPNGTGLDLNLSMRHDGSDAQVRQLRVKTLCLDADGRVVGTTPDWPYLPGRGQQSHDELRLEGCEHAQYGLEFKAEGREGQPLHGRILVVEPGLHRPEA